MEFESIKDKKPERYQKIIGVVTFGKLKGIYLNADIMQTKQGLYNFTKWKSDEQGEK